MSQVNRVSGRTSLADSGFIGGEYSMDIVKSPAGAGLDTIRHWKCGAGSELVIRSVVGMVDRLLQLD